MAKKAGSGQNGEKRKLSQEAVRAGGSRKSQRQQPHPQRQSPSPRSQVSTRVSTKSAGKRQPVPERTSAAASSSGPRPAASSVLKCLGCGKLEGKAVKWAKHVQKWDKRANELVQVAEDDRCYACDDVYQRGFSHISWPLFCSRGDKDAMIQENVKQAEESGAASSQDATAAKMAGVKFEVTSSALILNEKELMTAMRVNRLPAHMKSIPKIKVPKLVTTELEAARGNVEMEECFCFKDPANPYRTAKVVQTMETREVQERLMQGPFWNRHSTSVMQSDSQKLLETTKAGDLVVGHKNLQELERWIARRALRKDDEPAEKRPRGSETQASCFQMDDGADEPGDAGDDEEDQEEEESADLEESEEEDAESNNDEKAAAADLNESQQQATPTKALAFRRCSSDASLGQSPSCAGISEKDGDDGNLTGAAVYSNLLE